MNVISCCLKSCSFANSMIYKIINSNEDGKWTVTINVCGAIVSNTHTFLRIAQNNVVQRRLRVVWRQQCTPCSFMRCSACFSLSSVPFMLSDIGIDGHLYTGPSRLPTLIRCQTTNSDFELKNNYRHQTPYRNRCCYLLVQWRKRLERRFC